MGVEKNKRRAYNKKRAAIYLYKNAPTCREVARFISHRLGSVGVPVYINSEGSIKYDAWN